MEKLTVAEVETLISLKSAIYISLYLPTHRFGQAVNEGQDPIQFKDQLYEIKATMQARGFKTPYIEGLLKPALNLQQDLMTWKDMNQGLAVFIADNFFKIKKVPFTFQPGNFVADQFILTPLLPLINETEEFYILTLSQKTLKLYRAGKYAIEEVKNINQYIPNMETYGRYFEFEKQHQGHAQTGIDVEKIHRFGHRQEKDAHKVYLKGYFDKVDDGIFDFLRDSGLPLILMGAEGSVSIYKEANSYQGLIEEPVYGNFETAPLKEIHDKAWGIVESYFKESLQAKINTYKLLAGTGNTSYDIKDIYKAALDGRIDTFFYAENSYLWAQVNQNGEIDLHDHQKANDLELLNIIAVHTIMNNGTAISLPKDKVPEKGLDVNVVAVYRY